MELKSVLSPIWAFSLSAGTRDCVQKTTATKTAKSVATFRRRFRSME